MVAAPGFAVAALIAPTSSPAPPAATLGDCDAQGFAQLLRPSMAPAHAQAHWLSRRYIRWPGAPGAHSKFALYHAGPGGISARAGQRVGGLAQRTALSPRAAPLSAAVAQRFRFVEAGVDLALPAAAVARLPGWLQGELVLAEEDRDGRVLRATQLQPAGALDDLYAAAELADDLGLVIAAKAPVGGSTIQAGGSPNHANKPTASRAAAPTRPSTTTRFALWAPTAQRVQLCLYADGQSPAQRLLPLRRDAASGIWRGQQAQDLSGASYTYLVDVHVRGVGLVRNRVTDPYAISLNTDSQRATIADLRAPALKPAGWDDTPRPTTVAAPTDMVIYELHVRDFSINDTSVSAANRGKYLAFTEAQSRGMQHLRALAQAGLTDVHLLPVFDIASIPEAGCTTPGPLPGGPADEAQQAAIKASKQQDCFNWGYDPLHYTAPEGSYASSAADGAVRIRELRAMVQGLHRAGLRVGMDVVYNHTPEGGQHRHSVLDRIVPGYYHRYNAQGEIERSTCCANTATEHAMMARLMSDSVLTWARHYAIDSFRFDLMGHQPRAAMLALQQRLKRETGRDIQLLGEGWNFGEVENGRRFVQASQLSLNGSAIGSFSDRARDAVRGGGASDSGLDMITRQGYIFGLHYDPNERVQATAASRSELLRAADMVRVGLAGSIQSYALHTHDGPTRRLDAIAYGHQPAGYASQPAEVVNYVENHDNQTLFDAGAYKLPQATTSADRARVQILGAAINAFSQGVAYFHAGIDTLRSKSLDRNSYDSGDWFNRLDWSYQDNYFGTGLPLKDDNGADWPLMRPILSNPSIKPTPADIAFTRDAFRDLLRIRASTTLLRLRSADEIKQRLRFFNTGPGQVPTVLAAHINGRGHPGAGFAELVYLINVDKVAQQVSDATLIGKALRLHPVHRSTGAGSGSSSGSGSDTGTGAGTPAADSRAGDARFDAANGRFTVPPRTAVVYVVEAAN